jgi:hypothetical protein
MSTRNGHTKCGGEEASLEVDFVPFVVKNALN